MYMRAVTVRIVYVSLMGLGILLGATLRQSAVQAAPATAANAAQPAVEIAALPLVTLPTVHVQTRALRAGSPRAAAVAAVETDARVRMRIDAPSGAVGGASLPSLRLDMPYYSFGKLLPRVGKE